MVTNLKQLHKIESSLEKLHKEFNEQVSIIDKDTKDFHNAIIKLSAKYPDHTELLQFIVFVNDKLETNHDLFRTVVVDSFNDLVKQKQELVQVIIENRDKTNVTPETKPGFFTNIFSKVKSFKDIKIVFISGAVMTLSLAAMLAPEALKELIIWFTKLFV